MNNPNLLQATQLKDENDAASFLIKHGPIKVVPRDLINAYAKNKLVFTVADTSNFSDADWDNFVRVAVRIDNSFLEHVKWESLSLIKICTLFTYDHEIINHIPHKILVDCIPLVKYLAEGASVKGASKEYLTILNKLKNRTMLEKTKR